MNFFINAIACLTILTPGIGLAQQRPSDNELIAALWTLTNQTEPITLEEVANRLHMNLSKYDDSSRFYLQLGWKQVLTAEKDGANAVTDESSPVWGIWLSGVKQDSSMEKYRQPGKPFLQVLRVSLKKGVCVSADAVMKQTGVNVTNQYRPGFADVLGYEAHYFSSDNGETQGQLEVPMACSGQVDIRKTFSKNSDG